MKKHTAFLIITLLIISLISCKSNNKSLNEDEYIESVKKWQTERLKRLKSENGWLNLVGLYWLKEGQNPFGSNPANNIVFPEKAPSFIGSYITYKGNVSVTIDKDVDVFINDSLLKEHHVRTDIEDNTTTFKYESFRWYIIKRGDRFGIRLRDLESPLVDQIKEIPSYPVNPEWRIKAKFKKFKEPKSIAIPNVLGETEFENCYGELKFKIDDKEYNLMPLGDGVNGGLFLIFADETSAEETYGAGRFLSVDKPDENGITYIDFNKATNPPCAFTNYATCPLPPRENILSVKITAGEKINEHIGHH